MRLRKLHADHDPTDRIAAMNHVQALQAQGEIATGLLYLDPTAHDRDDRLAFSPRPDAAVELAGPAGVALLLRAPSVADVEAVTASGDVMPQKSTYFFPKTVDGVVFYHLDRCRG